MEPILFMVAVLVAALVYHHYTSEKFRTSWSALATSMDLEFNQAEESLSGDVDGVDVQVGIVVRGSGKHKRAYTVFSSPIIDISPLGLNLYKEGFFSKVGTALGMQDIKVGDPNFDSRFVIKCDYLDEANEFLANAGVRDALFTLSLLYENTQIEDGELRFELTGRQTNTGVLRKGINDLTECVSRMDQAQNETYDRKQVTAPAPDIKLEDPPTEKTLNDEDGRIQKWARPSDEPHGDADDDILW